MMYVVAMVHKSFSLASGSQSVASATSSSIKLKKNENEEVEGNTEIYENKINVLCCS